MKAKKSTLQDIEGLKIKKRKLSDIPLHERVDIVHKVLIQFYKYEEISHIHNISCGLIGRLVSKSKSNPQFFEELHWKAESRDKENDKIEEAAIEVIERQGLIFNTY